MYISRYITAHRTIHIHYIHHIHIVYRCKLYKTQMDILTISIYMQGHVKVVIRMHFKNFYASLDYVFFK